MKKVLLVGLVGMVVGVLAWGGFNTAMEATNDMSFCISCHEMRDNVYVEYLESPHYQNASGVRATCPDCHVPRDWTHKVIRKVQATKELYHWALGTIDTKEKFEAHRHELAKHEWARMRANDSRECRNCHSFEAMDFHKQSIRAQRSMRDAAKNGKTCIDCHKAVAHKMPDINATHRAMFSDLAAAAETADPSDGETVAALEDRPLTASPDGAAVGTLLAGNTARILDRDGEALEIEVTGWTRSGDEGTLYAFSGKRMAVATLAEGAGAVMEPGGAEEKDKAGRTWTDYRLTAWIPAAGITADRDAMRAYAERMYDDNCTLCHDKHGPDEYVANDWIGHFNSMRRLTPLTDQEASILLTYLQFSAKDADASDGSASR